MNKILPIAGLSLALCSAVPAPLSAQGCSDYPFGNGMNIEAVEGGVRIISTAAVGVSFDDVDSLNDARTEAGLAARATIVRFMQEEIRIEESVRRAVQETRSMQGETRQASRNETIQRIRNLEGNASGLIRGVVALGECYTPGREMRVSVGLKPETIAQAEGLSSQVRRSVANQPSPSVGNLPPASPTTTPPPAPGTALGPNRVPGYSDTQRLNRF